VQNHDSSEYRMVNVGEKIPTRRICHAQGELLAKPETLLAIRNGTLPKGNVLPLAEAAGILAVKKTSEVLPLCHPLPIDAASIGFRFSETSVTVLCEVTAHAKTGVEMEALSGASAALLCLYDLAKGIDPVLEISGIRLIQKQGGKSGLWTHPKHSSRTPVPSGDWASLRISVITLSDRCARGESEDRSGPALQTALESQGARSISRTLLPDESEALRAEILSSVESGIDLILTTGGTGVGPRDRTPEALAALANSLGPSSARLIPGYGERIRAEGLKHTPLSSLSRGEAYLFKSTLVVSLPGSEKGALESLDAVAELIPHTLRVARGANHSSSPSPEPKNSQAFTR